MSFHKHGQQPEYVEEEFYAEEEVVHHHPHSLDYCEVYPAPPQHYGKHSNCSSSSNHFKRNERLGELGALAAGAFALYEENKARKDPEHARKHHLEAGAAALGALGAGGYAYHQHIRQNNKLEEWRCCK